uniref:Puromycin-sensitive aminopeptidase-like isoform X1 n=3 Tax=Populus alba TaxID=43335 RepID=A0A4U5PLW0_POPAL|nr:puromycin-sensitive aminopeptidase-like isoform X1 [Populus alba]
MARLILPCKSSCLAKTSLLGLISSAPLRATGRPSCFQSSVRNISKYRGFLSSEVAFRRKYRFSYPALHRDKQDRRRLICAVATEPLPKQVEESKMDAPKEIFLKDHKLPDYYFDSVDLTFLLGDEKTIVSSKITVLPRVEGSSSSLVLDGADLKLLSVKVNGEELKNGDYHLESRHLTILSPPSGKFKLEIVTEIYPQKNTSLEGLYKSSGNFCTQCEAEGFRKITYYQDRPDIMAKYTVRIEADKSLYPVLLSNGNLLEQGDLEGGKHYVLWEDPFKKPCYLFALVAGQLESRDDTFVTRSGRKVSLRIWTPAQDVPKTAHAMYSLKAAMKWDEDVFGLEYDLDLFNIVAVPDFNMGAMENKSLNIFNSKLVLASPETASDADYAAILGVIGHEYFHNWTGNRVTCRDWFQLSLKEGLTVFRDQEFSSDMGSRTVKRISDVSKLRISQFPQDASPMAHPVRPHSYIKGAEVVRMYKTLLGSQGFRKGMDLYFKRHDGQAVTCEDFFAAMRDANDADFANFLQWYSQAGTPLVKVTSTYDAEAHTFTLKFSQEVPPTPGQPVKEPMFIPVVLGLLDTSGKDMPLSCVYHDGALKSIASDSQPAYSTILRVTKKEEEFVFSDILERPVPSLLRGFSAPIRLESDLSDSDLFFLLAHDSDEFNRWEAGQVLARKLMLSLVADCQQGKPLVLNPKFVQGLRSILSDSNLDKEFIAKAITLPGEGEIMDMMEVADPDAVHAVRSFIRKQLASELKAEFLRTVENNRSSEEYVFNHPDMARRALKNIALAYLASLEDQELTELALHEYKAATNMTDQFAALAAIAQNPGKTCDEVLADFYTKWQDEFLVVNKWFALQAMSDVPGNVENVRNLLNHPAFDLRNPNKVYSLIGGFCSSPVNFHAKDGSGYKFLGEIVVQLDKINPQVASRMVSAFSRWKRYDETRQNLAKAQLEMIVSANGLSENLRATGRPSCFQSSVENNRSSEEYVFNHPDMARRALKNIALAYLASLEDQELTELALHEYKAATNMTDQFAALAAIAQNPGKTCDEVLADFYTKWQDEFLVVNKWFALQAMSDVPGNVENVRNLLNHPAFDLRNPNKVRSLIGGFCSSPVNFHAKDGSGYKFLGEIVVQLDKINPQVASHRVSAFSRWKRYDETRQNLAKAQLEMIVSANGLSENVFEIASKSLAA